jgi:hypothetical protein
MSNAINRSSLRTLRILLGNAKQDIPSLIPNSREKLTQVLRKLIGLAAHSVLAGLSFWHEELQACCH